MANKVTAKMPQQLPNTTKGRIKYLRLKNQKKQEDIADKVLNVSRIMYGYYENEENKRVVPIEVIIKLAKHYQVSTDFLLCLIDEPTNDMKLQAVCKYTGLSPKAIEKIRLYLSSEKHFGILAAINDIIENENFYQLMALFRAYIDFPFVKYANKEDEDISWRSPLGVFSTEVTVKKIDILEFKLIDVFKNIAKELEGKLKIEYESGKIDSRFYYWFLDVAYERRKAISEATYEKALVDFAKGNYYIPKPDYKVEN